MEHFILSYDEINSKKTEGTEFRQRILEVLLEYGADHKSFFGWVETTFTFSSDVSNPRIKNTEDYNKSPFTYWNSLIATKFTKQELNYVLARVLDGSLHKAVQNGNPKPKENEGLQNDIDIVKKKLGIKD